MPGLPSLSSWVAPTLSVEEVDKRIQELKTVQYWLEQNGHALKATIQALEVQKMTLSTLRGMNVRMEDLASAFTRPPTSARIPRRPEPPAPNPNPKRSPRPTKRAGAEARAKAAAGARRPGRGPGVVDPLQWWGALTQQFQQIASSALQDAAQLKVPVMAQPLGDPAWARGLRRQGARPSRPPRRRRRRRRPPRRQRSRQAARADAQARGV